MNDAESLEPRAAELLEHAKAGSPEWHRLALELIDDLELIFASIGTDDANELEEEDDPWAA